MESIKVSDHSYLIDTVTGQVDILESKLVNSIKFSYENPLPFEQSVNIRDYANKAESEKIKELSAALKKAQEDIAKSEEFKKLYKAAEQALSNIRSAGNNYSEWAVWAQKMAAWGMEPTRWEKPSTAAPRDLVVYETQSSMIESLEQDNKELTLKIARISQDKNELQSVLCCINAQLFKAQGLGFI